MACNEMRKRHFIDRIYVNINININYNMKTYQKRKIRRERRRGDKETQSLSRLVTWRRLENVQIKTASLHAQIPVKY